MFSPGSQKNALDELMQLLSGADAQKILAMVKAKGAAAPMDDSAKDGMPEPDADDAPDATADVCPMCGGTGKAK